MWVPSHIGITGNKMADKAVNLATRIIPYPTSTDLPVNDIKSFIKYKMYAMWQKHCDSIPPSNKLKAIKKHKKMAYPLPSQQTLGNGHHKNQNRPLLRYPLLSFKQKPSTHIRQMSN